MNLINFGENFLDSGSNLKISLKSFADIASWYLQHCCVECLTECRSTIVFLSNFGAEAVTSLLIMIKTKAPETYITYSTIQTDPWIELLGKKIGIP